MSVENRIEALKDKHSNLDLSIHEENTRPHPDENAIHGFKKQKLKIKDEIEHLTLQ